MRQARRERPRRTACR